MPTPFTDALGMLENVARFEAQKIVDENHDKFLRFLSLSITSELTCQKGYFLNSDNVCEDVDECVDGQCHSWGCKTQN